METQTGDNRQVILNTLRWLIGALAVIAIMWQLWSTFSLHSVKFLDPMKFKEEFGGKDFVTNYESRLTDARKYLDKPGHLGYCSEEGQDKASYYLHYTLTQYYLAPNLISTNTESDTVLYNLYNSIQLNENTNYHLTHGWHVIKNFNNGIIILAK